MEVFRRRIWSEEQVWAWGAAESGIAALTEEDRDDISEREPGLIEDARRSATGRRDFLQVLRRALDRARRWARLPSTGGRPVGTVRCDRLDGLFTPQELERSRTLSRYVGRVAAAKPYVRDWRRRCLDDVLLSARDLGPFLASPAMRSLPLRT